MATSSAPATPAVCRGCGCTEGDACLVEIGMLFDEPWVVGCSWVERDLCSGCADPAHRLRGPVVDHRAPARAGAGQG